MDWQSVDWTSCYILSVNATDYQVTIRFADDDTYLVDVPRVLMDGIIRHAEDRFIQQDLERDDQEHGLY